jgi:tetratricopeptide (TPR) repeat protein
MRRLTMGSNPNLTLTLVLLCLFANSAVSGQSGQQRSKSQSEMASAQLQGVVRSSNGLPVAGVTISLQANGTHPLTALTDSAGAYHFKIHPGVYTLRAQKVGEGSATSAQLVLQGDKSKTIDLTLAAENQLQPEPSSTQPEFFDEPHFTVAGVSDTTNLGGHGSQAVVRNRDSLAAATASLKDSPVNSGTESANASEEKLLREDLVRQPNAFNTNHRLGKLLVDKAKAREGIPYLERAYKTSPGDFDNAYELARAYQGAGAFKLARNHVRTLLTTQRNSQQQADLHHLLGDIDEKLGDPLGAVRDYQLAAELSPSETNYFDWGAELLLHRAAEPAIEVFIKGNRLFPHSIRLLTGLGSAWYSHGSYDQAVKHLCAASDLNPNDPNPYIFMGKMQAPEAVESNEIVERLARFAQLEPQNSLANYYYAAALSKQGSSAEDSVHLDQIQSLLEKSAHLDPKFSLAYLELGNLYSQRGDSSNAISNYQHAIEIDPQLEQAHYRLARLYNQTGETAKAHTEMQKYQEISRQKTQEVDRQQHELQQFVYEMRDSTPSSLPH